MDRSFESFRWRWLRRSWCPGGSLLGGFAGRSFVLSDATGRSGLLTCIVATAGAVVGAGVVGVIVYPASGAEVVTSAARRVTEGEAVVAKAMSSLPRVKT